MRQVWLAAVSVLVLACSTAPDPQVAAVAGPSAADACDHFFDVLTRPRCGSTAPPGSALDAMRVRHRQSCVARLALQGTSSTSARLDACAAAGDVLSCEATERPDPCITLPGALADEEPCQDDAQCASTRCARSFGTASDGGSAVVPGCGRCMPAGRTGEPCAGATGDGCVDGTACESGDAGRVCVAVVYGGAGDSCDLEARRCANGLTCDAASGRCVALGGARGPGIVAWASPGESCSLTTSCLLGGCSASGARCPQVLPDGASCVAFDPEKTCDSFAACTDGRCTLEYTGSCIVPPP